jgi:DNA polymerase III delta subunit
VDYLAFLRSAERGHPPPVALLHGGDAQLLDDALRAATRAMAPDPSLTVFDRDVFDGREVEVDAVVTAALTLPVQAAFRLVVVRRCQALMARGAEGLARYVAEPNPTTCLLLLADEPLGASRDRKNPHWLLDVMPAPAVIELLPRRGRALEEWLRQRASVEGLTVSEEAARLLVQWVGDDSATLLGEVRKAALAGGPTNTGVGVNEVTAVVGEHRLSGIFDLTRAIERHELGLALRTLEQLLVAGTPCSCWPRWDGRCGRRCWFRSGEPAASPWSRSRGPCGARRAPSKPSWPPPPEGPCRPWWPGWRNAGGRSGGSSPGARPGPSSPRWSRSSRVRDEAQRRPRPAARIRYLTGLAETGETAGEGRLLAGGGIAVHHTFAHCSVEGSDGGQGRRAGIGAPLDADGPGHLHRGPNSRALRAVTRPPLLVLTDPFQRRFRVGQRPVPPWEIPDGFCRKEGRIASGFGPPGIAGAPGARARTLLS